MYVKDGDYPRQHKGSYKKREGSRKKAIYSDELMDEIRKVAHRDKFRRYFTIEGVDQQVKAPSRQIRTCWCFIDWEKVTI
jgi:predicted nucleic acid-binding protein